MYFGACVSVPGMGGRPLQGINTNQHVYLSSFDNFFVIIVHRIHLDHKGDQSSKNI